MSNVVIEIPTCGRMMSKLSDVAVQMKCGKFETFISNRKPLATQNLPLTTSQNLSSLLLAMQTPRQSLQSQL